MFHVAAKVAPRVLGIVAAGTLLGSIATPAHAAPTAPASVAQRTTAADSSYAVAASLRSRIVRTARGEIGYHEVGTTNCTKYGKECAPWCGRFTMWAYWKVGISYTNYYGVKAIRHWAAKRHKTFKNVKTAKPGDLVIWSSLGHMGVVTGESGTMLRVVSGNLGNAVAERWYPYKTFGGGGIRP